MSEKNKGCVYFFKHTGLDPVKIGYSANASPIKRFEQFKTYAPYGAQLIGFINTIDPEKLESDLHKKYRSHRMMGEWFDIKIEDVNKEILFHSNIEDIRDKNEFEILWAKKRSNKKTSDPVTHIDKIYSFFDKNVVLDTRIYSSDFYIDFRKHIDDPKFNIDKRSLTKHLKNYCEINMYNYETKASNGIRFHLITLKSIIQL